MGFRKGSHKLHSRLISPKARAPPFSFPKPYEPFKRSGRIQAFASNEIVLYILRWHNVDNMSVEKYPTCL